jgi:hypothetical protein
MAQVKQAECYADSALGIYIPQHFAESYNSEQWCYIDKADIAILLIGPEHEQYWDTWQDVLDIAETVCGGVLHQDGDLWIVWAQDAIDAVNDHCAYVLEYYESHENAGDNYAFCVSENWTWSREERLTKQLVGPEVQDLSKDCFEKGRWVSKWLVDPMGLDIDELSNIALDIFQMRSGSIYGPYQEGIVLDSFAVQKVEIPLDHLGIDAITMDLIRESCDPYISGTDTAYMSTDAVWYAVLDPDAFQEAIADMVATNKESE